VIPDRTPWQVCQPPSATCLILIITTHQERPQMFKQFYSCPYCQRRSGTISIDTTAAVAWLDQHPGGCDFYVNKCPQQNIVRFDRDQLNGQQCPHLIAASINIEHLLVSVDGKTLVEQAFIAELIHPWFADHDTDCGLDRFLWAEVLSSLSDGTFSPTTPFHIQRVEIEHEEVELDGSSRQFRFYGRMIAAMEPEQFLLELRAGAEQCRSAAPIGS
jgi:hypothetical protein